MNPVAQPPSFSTPSLEVARRIAHLRPVAGLAKVLQSLEAASYKGHADQYQHVVAQLSTLLLEAEPDEILYSIFKAYPAAGELYENLRYEHAGLCLQNLDAATGAEQALRNALQAIGQR